MVTVHLYRTSADSAATTAWNHFAMSEIKCARPGALIEVVAHLLVGALVIGDRTLDRILEVR